MPDPLHQAGSAAAAAATDTDTLIEQARLAAMEAIELARLAAESARLARELNARALGVDRKERPEPVQPVATVTAATRDQPCPAPDEQTGALSTTPSPRRRSSKARLQAHVARARTQHVPATARVRVRVRAPNRPRAVSVSSFLRRNWSSMTISGGVIAAALALLALYIMPAVTNQRLNTVIASFADELAPVEDPIPVEQPVEPEESQPAQKQPEVIPNQEPVVPDPAPTEPVAAEKSVAPAEPSPPVDFAAAGGRSSEARTVLLEKFGGTPASESAVGSALDWFTRHQRRDGSWNFNAVGASGDAGTVDNPLGATSYVLLTFLGAGQTHLKGRYKRNVAAGLDYLTRHGRPVGGNMIDFSGVGPTDKDTHERFYVHGAAATALTEAFAMTGDRRLRPYAQGAINAIVAAQDPRGGGWRYIPHEPGSTSVTGLQITALISAKKAGLQVPDHCFTLATRYLNSVQSDSNGDRYGYTAARPTYQSSVTAIAVLSRMYLGWKRETPELKRAVRLLDEKGPASENLYYIYYATQVMRHWGGPEWQRWNEFTRDELVSSQATDGDASGSWKPRNRSNEARAGGRLFVTCLATLTLEVYYRHLPLYEDL